MRRLVLTDAAEADLEAIANRIALDSPRRAETFVNELRESCLKLTEMPLRFSLVPRYSKVGVRRRVHGNYLIFCRVSDHFVQVLRVVHGAVDLEHLIMPDA
jgi:plasmid stabilization system protein ParE